ncbi:MAG: S41 family peptidase [Vicinamibacterales bacterium]
MPKNRIAAAQRGVALADAVPARQARARSRRAAKTRAARAGRRAPAGKASGTLAGPFLAHGSLTITERRRIIDAFERVLEGVYTHLPLKRARYGFDPIQRLRILRTQVDQLTDDTFHIELADIVTRLRDAHTRYIGPAELEPKVAALPFLVEMVGTTEAPAYVVTKVGRRLDSAFKPGVVLAYWNGVPIDRAVQRHADREVGGRPDTQRACAVQSLTLRSLRYGPPPDEHWVVVGYRTAPAGGGAGQAKEIRLPWKIVDPSDVDAELSGRPAGRAAKARRLRRAIDPAAEAVRRAKMLLFAPHALTGKQARAPKPSARRASATEIVPTELPEVLKVMTIDAPGGPFGYVRIYSFDIDSDADLLDELLRLFPLLPDRGLIIDVRGNPGGYILAAERALQLFTPNRILPTRFSTLATPLTRDIAMADAAASELKPWRVSLEAAVRNGELYAQAIPITTPEECNDLGQHYGGPVVLVGDSTTYSSGDLFAAGFVDNAIGPFLCVGTATGAGGANVWEYSDLRQALAGSAAALPALPDGINLTLSFRRATRSGPSEGLPIEDVGIEGTPYAMTRDDVLHGNRDLIAACVAVLKRQPFSRLSAVLDKPGRSIAVTTSGLDHLDALFDGHPGTAERIDGNATTTIGYPAGTRTVELTGFSRGEVRQRRRIPVRR